VSGNSLHYGLLLPVCMMLFVNAIIFVLVVFSLCKTASSSKNKLGDRADIATQVRIAASCCALLGLTWLFGVLAIGESRLLFQYLFCIFNSLQGAFIFYFNIFRQSRTLNAWRGFLAGKGRHNTLSGASSSHSHSKTKSMSNHNYEQQELEPLPLPEFTLPRSSPHCTLSPEKTSDDDGGPQVSIIERDNCDFKTAAYSATPAAELSFTSFVER